MKAVEIDEAMHMLAAMKAVPRWQRRAETRMANKLGALMQQAVREMRAKLEQQGIPSSPVDRAQLLMPWVGIEDTAVDIAVEGSLEAGYHGRNRVVDELRKAGASIPASGAIPDRVAEILRERAVNTVMIPLGRIRGDLKALLEQAQAEGIGIFDTAGRLMEMGEQVRYYEAERIARTEIQSAQNEVAHDTMRDLGVQYEQWVSAGDSRVRDTVDASHVEMDGQIAMIGERFSNGLLHPGDRAGPIEEWINCRCRSVPFIMPAGRGAPHGKAWFRESDLI